MGPKGFQLQRPLIYLYGITPGVYDPIFPCYITADRPGELAFHLTPDLESLRPIPELHPPQLEVQRAYAMRAVKTRLHQRRFRELVVSAYDCRCSVCTLRHRELLDAAHIVPDREERGFAEIPNGLALCRIHHAAFDANILGVDADGKVHVRMQPQARLPRGAFRAVQSRLGRPSPSPFNVDPTRPKSLIRRRLPRVYIRRAFSPSRMTKVEMLEREIAELPPEELAIFREWFAAFDAKAWDRQLEADAEAGKLNAVAESALSEYRAGKTRPL